MYAIELPKELLGRLARLRAITGKSIAGQVREAVQDYLEREKLRLLAVTSGGGEERADGHDEDPPSS